MAHSVGEQAARAVKNSERKKIEEMRTPEEIIKGIRGNLAAHLAVTPNDTAFLLAQYDALVPVVQTAAAAIARVVTAEAQAALQLARAESAEAECKDLRSLNTQFRDIYLEDERLKANGGAL